MSNHIRTHTLLYIIYHNTFSGIAVCVWSLEMIAILSRDEHEEKSLWYVCESIVALGVFFLLVSGGLSEDLQSKCQKLHQGEESTHVPVNHTASKIRLRVKAKVWKDSLLEKLCFDTQIELHFYTSDVNSLLCFSSLHLSLSPHPSLPLVLSL